MSLLGGIPLADLERVLGQIDGERTAGEVAAACPDLDPEAVLHLLAALDGELVHRGGSLAGLGLRVGPAAVPGYSGVMLPLRWTDRHFAFNLPEELFPVVVERLRGTPARIEDKVRGLSPALLTRRDGDAWSIQEHIGHLLDLDELHAGRLDDFLAGVEVLRAADMTNRKTHEASHNERPIAELLRDFRRERERFVARLDAWDENLVSLTALHPRLNQPMRVIDMAFFTAEHDDHHLARMTELARRGQGATA